MHKPQKEAVIMPDKWLLSVSSVLTCPTVETQDLTHFFSRRVLLDRAYTDYDNIFHGLDPEILNLPLPPSPPPPPPPTTTSRSPAANKFASTSETNTSDRSSSSFNSSLSSSSPSSTDLSQILLNIKSCRWRHFRPRTLPLHELDNAHPLFRKLSRGLKRPVSASAAGGQPYGVQRPARVVPTPAPVAGKWIGCLQTHPVWMHSVRLLPSVRLLYFVLTAGQGCRPPSLLWETWLWKYSVENRTSIHPHWLLPMSLFHRVIFFILQKTF